MIKLGIESMHLVAKAAGADLLSIQQDVASGAAELVLLDKCAFVFRVEDTAEGREMVVVCAQGKGLASHCQKLLKAATRIGAKSIRFHTANHKLGAAMRRWGAQEVQRVYKVAVPNG